MTPLPLSSSNEGSTDVLPAGTSSQIATAADASLLMEQLRRLSDDVQTLTPETAQLSLAEKATTPLAMLESIERVKRWGPTCEIASYTTGTQEEDRGYVTPRSHSTMFSPDPLADDFVPSDMDVDDSEVSDPPAKSRASRFSSSLGLCFRLLLLHHH